MPELYLLFLFLTFLLFTGVKFFSLGIKKPKTVVLDLNDLSVIIPFRNEEQNLPMLLASLSKQDLLPRDIILVNDHSEDESVPIVQKFIDDRKIGKLIHLENGMVGKKQALNLGIQNATTQFVLTLDADVILSDEYMKSLRNLPAYSLVSLPVVMQGKSFLSRLFSTEYSFFNAFNYLFSSIWPISISGANLLFDSKAVNYERQMKGHQHLASGDDYFLLKAFRKNRTFIYTINEFNLSVSTDAPRSLKSYFDQRVRWLGKSKFQIDWMDVLIGTFILLYFVGGFIALLSSLILSHWILLGSIFILRFLLDALVYLNYAQRLRLTRNVLMLPFFQLIYPLLFLTVAILSLFYKPSWKGRSAKT